MLFELFVWIGIGLLAGGLAGLLGIGGGLVIVPAMTWLLQAAGAPLDLALPTAVATALASMLLTSASSAWAHARQHSLDGAAAMRLGPAVAMGAGLGGWIATRIPGEALAKVFALLVALIALRMLWPSSGSSTRVGGLPRPRGWWAVGPVSGALSAMIGIGGGSFNVPYLRYNGYPMLVAVGTAAACGWPIALAGTLAFLLPAAAAPWPGRLGPVHPPAAAAIGVAGALAAPLGARLAKRVGSVALARLFALFLLFVALRMALQ